MIQKECIKCGKPFSVSPSLQRVKYCSRICYWSSKKGIAPKCRNLNLTGNQFAKGKKPWNKGMVWQEMRGVNNPNWKGGKKLSNGYVFVYCPKHPYSSKNYYPLHRLVCELALRRYLSKSEEPHHINGIKSDNRPENLYLFPNKSEHIKYHCVVNNPLNLKEQPYIKIITKSNLSL